MTTKIPQTCHPGWGPGDCGSPIWLEEDDGTNTIVAIVEGYYEKREKPSGTYHSPSYVSLIANTDVLDFIYHLSYMDSD